ncbi:heme lyase CcmF/NrfE family subunit [Hyphobacterium marinum]|uniref:Heme lyase CcmF/NrfE family subunit n=1 Tax=Hyphobacterium marinum TaxID=3116574 RepID=A0ABU7M0G8_9PROT|nr:heme lyase CcmF/NrfE family subunit [Hyphobacterium sp. Y6023]MEE2567312.1 heme lyase CcmF/NrfE family subunit [Hyphobacterium sp. Y6023]
MIAELGRFLVAIALIASVAQLLFGWRAARAGNVGPLAVATGRASAVALGTLGAAFVLLAVLFLQSDFSVGYVAANSHVDKPVFYKIAAVWGGHEGSMLLWCLLLAGVGAGLNRWGPRSDDGLRLRATAVQGGLQLLFIAFLFFASNPFDRLDPAELAGRGLNPILQDPALAMHPPMLYVGYVGLSAAFSLAAAGLIEGRGGRVLAEALRPWAVAAWAFLTAGISLGAWWAYYELGWGGWWFWDPVENASFMPWLVATALIHSAIATQRSGAFPGWTAFLALTAFSLSALGAFLVRSGVLTSVHAFALDPERGLWILVMLAVIAGGGLALFGWRASTLGRGDGFEPTSREAFIGANNLFLVVTAGVVLTGTLMPLIIDALGGRMISVGAPYFNTVATPFLALLLVFLPFAPFLPWRKAGLRPVAISLTAALWLVPASIAGLALMFAGGSIFAIAGAFVGAWAIAGAISDYQRSRGQAGLGPRLASAGRSMAHAGIGLVALGAAADSTGAPEISRSLAPGETMQVGDTILALESVTRADGANYMADSAILVATEGGRTLGRLRPERRFYPANDQNTREVAIRSGVRGDLYVSLGDPHTRGDGTVAYEVRASFNPFVWLLGLGAALIALGGLTALAGQAAHRRRPA